MDIQVLVCPSCHLQLHSCDGQCGGNEWNAHYQGPPTASSERIQREQAALPRLAPLETSFSLHQKRGEEAQEMELDVVLGVVGGGGDVLSDTF